MALQLKPPAAGGHRPRPLTNRLRHRGPVPVPDADLIVGHAVDGEVLPEDSVAEIVAAECRCQCRYDWIW